ncbi:nucleotidyl transferase AbiEii/AbiGii toxin family protein (plasmid) [Rhizobium leguminosarum]|uniref:nucleotidyl transferase AbiEii/AbiGii toxin family protein n=1 Tax=Rhizobium TaxID=379 RepID=UPI0010325149|nr:MULTISPECIES: nucleotidyl transferase AbiEii/AbiGii toxin family protein [Rhizobium]MBY3312537.1 nucleotidyl transferase AbiEii/AbiGii toxin family protein [Rhizobium laguerreae]TBF23675.1 nucleotidyl transferase AbiEii/AbiGii toxin family protein [Rhizobium leguminosarum]TBF47269.1 nucleotidyl transferase AbiEii/AbiGii toxin family protein [Rhizobium leguminosarum]TBF69155.1 nucleotidyl transferase AbiEii/AbiGii toxin family protein [Rhizobium leguminosarum]TBF85794.1 nucleotidyl transfera
MAERFLLLSGEDRREVLAIAAEKSRRPIHLLEKDTWVVWALQTLYGTALGDHLVFKGGTSLSKAYNAIRRFSEDVDLTYDIRALAHDLVGQNEEALPKTRSEEKRWSSEVRKRLPVWVSETVRPLIVDAISAQSLPTTVRVEGDRLFIDYEATGGGSGYVAPSVMLEFGARSTGEPASVRDVSCDAAGLVDGIEFPTARPRVMHAERTFWEKATAIHVFCLQERLRGERFSRHWHDIVRLDDIGIADSAMADRTLAQSVAQHKSMFFAEKAADKTPIDYEAAVGGRLQLTPSGAGRAELERDYARMLEDGLLLDEAETFDELFSRCAKIQDKANASC